MIKHVWNRKLGTALALLAATLLGGCGESTNIEPENAGKVSSCSSLLNVTCVTGRLIDDTVFNVDYECASSSGSVRSVTGVDGSFSCPSGSEVTFSLINPENDEFRIELGKVIVRLPAQIYGENSMTPIYFYVTPRDLAGDGEGSSLSTRALNITRLLQTLSDDPTDADQSGHLPTRTIRITDDDKREINADTMVDTLMLSGGIAGNPALPTGGTFDLEIQDYLNAVGKFPLIPGAQAETALTKGIYSTMAGMYAMPGGSVLSIGALTPTDGVTDADTGAMVGYDLMAGKTFLGTVYAVVDRRGRTIASGVYSYGLSSGNTWSIWSSPEAMQLASTGTARNNMSYWPIDGSLTRMEMSLLGASDTSRKIDFTQGLMRREAVAGSSSVYSNLFKETGTLGQYGKWNMTDAGGLTTYITGGAYTFEHTIAVAPLMNPSVWQDDGTFPLPVTVTIYNRDYDNAACSSTLGCEMARLRMVILKDGNIISDRFQTCGAGVDPETLVVNGNAAQQEIPLGVVANALDTLKDGSGAAIKTLNLLVMLPDDPRMDETLDVQPGFEDYLPYLQFGSNFGDYSVLRLDGAADQYDMYGLCTQPLATGGFCSTVDSFHPRVASWLNSYTFVRALNLIEQEPTPPGTDTLIYNMGGLMSSERTAPASCL